MRRINLPLVLDTVFAGLCAFLLFFTAIRYYTKNVYIALAFAVPASLLSGSLAYLYISKKHNKRLLISRDEKQKKLLALHLSLSSDGYITELFEKALSTDDDKLLKRGGKLFSKEKAYFFAFSMQPLNEDGVARVIKYRADGKKVIFCNTVSVEAARLCTSFCIDIKTIDDVYGILKEKELLPEKYVYEGPEKQGILKRIKARFNKKLCAPLFWSGAALLALSYFTFFPVYYIVSGGIMLILSAVALVID